jgi:ABC-type dipeptide/oligopeptide/nickel transport system ATPase subunit
VPLLAKVKRQRAVLIVSHDVKELAPVCDVAWKMLPGGQLQKIPVDQLMMYSM